MSTYSEVKAALDGIASVISGSLRSQTQAKATLLSARNQLASLPTQFSKELSEIGKYTADAAHRALAKDELSQLTTEFQELKTAIEGELDALGVSYS